MVSPGLTPRPSLCGGCWRGGPGRGFVSPGLTPRPSLCVLAAGHLARGGQGFRRGSHPGLRCASGGGWRTACSGSSGFAGAHTPAFVVRGSGSGSAPRSATSFAGAHTPAFVVRTPADRRRRRWRRVSPGLTPRPSLCAAPEGIASALQGVRFRRGSHPGLRCAFLPPHWVSFSAASVSPGLTPRPSLCADRGLPVWRSTFQFRRGSHPGLRCAQTEVYLSGGQLSSFAGAHTPAFVVR